MLEGFRHGLVNRYQGAEARYLEYFGGLLLQTAEADLPLFCFQRLTDAQNTPETGAADKFKFTKIHDKIDIAFIYKGRQALFKFRCRQCIQGAFDRDYLYILFSTGFDYLHILLRDDR